MKTKFSSSGKVLGVNCLSPSAVITAWLKSPSHRAILLNRRYIHIGAAVGRGTVGGEPVMFLVILYGRLK